jgi:hypothetical protein
VHAETTAGRTKFALCASLPASNPPTGGPSVKPMPMAAPINPRVAARFAGVLTSEA